MKNPNWHSDEIILALDLYFDPLRGAIDKKNPKIIALSNLLKRLPIHKDKNITETFRNANGVSLKLSNFLPFDSNYTGKGMRGNSSLDQILFEKYSNDNNGLRKIAQQIKDIATDEDLKKEILQVEEDENSITDSVLEGQILYKLHKYRERKTKIVESKKRSILRKNGALRCEVCDFDFHSSYGNIGHGYIECHHLTPLSRFDKNAVTRLEDLALVCSNCHRMLHRKIDSISVEELRLIVQKAQ